MPGFDGTGPMGLGPMTGRGMGLCGRGFRLGFGRGFGRFGRGFGWRCMPGFVDINLSKEEQKKNPPGRAESP
ncbi:MAG: DUF5320 domain-containing protein [Candidatus Woesearchaeota archaeon]